MGKLSILQIAILTLFFAILGSLVVFEVTREVKAAQQGDQDQVDLQVLLEVSADHGAHWYNYSGDYNPGGDSVTVEPGESLDFRIRLWDEGTRDAVNADITGTVTNADKVDDLVVSNADLDGDTNDFNGFTFTNGGTGTVDIVANGSTPSADYQGLFGTITLGNDFSEDQTVITGTVTIDDYDPFGLAYSPSLIKKAHAEGVARTSTIRIVVQVAGEETVVEEEEENSAATEEVSLPNSGQKTYKDFLSKYLYF